MARRWTTLFLGCLGACALGAAAWGQEVGTVVALEGTVEIHRAGAATPATLGAAVAIGDEIRTAAGRVKIVLQDGSVLNLGTDTRLVIDRQVFDPARSRLLTLLRMLRGSLRAIVGDDYAQPGARYEVDTPTAVIGVRGTEFVIAYNPVVDVTEVVGIGGRTAVHSILDRARRGVIVRAQELTLVRRGSFPTAPVHIGDALFRQYIEGLDFIGGGAERMSRVDPWIVDGAVPPADRADVIVPAGTGTGEDAAAKAPRTDIGIRDDVSTLLEQPPAAVQSGGLGIEF